MFHTDSRQRCLIVVCLLVWLDCDWQTLCLIESFFGEKNQMQSDLETVVCFQSESGKSTASSSLVCLVVLINMNVKRRRTGFNLMFEFWWNFAKCGLEVENVKALSRKRSESHGSYPFMVVLWQTGQSLHHRITPGVTQELTTDHI